jgi:hypothetical protein
VIPAALLVLVIRAFPAGDRSLARVVAEVVIYSVATIAFTLVFERNLIRELAGYLRRRVPRPAPSPG